MSARGTATTKSGKKSSPRPAAMIRNGAGPETDTNGMHAQNVSSLDLEELLSALQSMREGSFAVRMAGDRTGLAGKIADTFNAIVSNNQRMAEQLERFGEMVGRQGKTRLRVKLCRSTGAWGEMEGSINTLID